MLARIVIVAGLAAVILFAVLAIRWWVSRRDGQLRAAPPSEIWGALSAKPDGRPTLVVFSSPSCVACRTTQAPAVDAMTAKLGDSTPRLIKIDITEQPEVAHAFRVLTVPTTVILDVQGHVSAINHGFATSEHLADQVGSAQTPERSLAGIHGKSSLQTPVE